MTSAVFAASRAKKVGARCEITIYEANSRVGKKILVTGNGRCNISNENMDASFFRGSTELFASVYERFDREDLLRFLHDGGLFTRTDYAGRIYPLSNQASSVLDFLRNQCQVNRIAIETDCRIVSVKKEASGEFVLNDRFRADVVILAAGGKAAPVHGSDGSGYELLKSFGVELTHLLPALTGINLTGFTKALKGIRAEGSITLRSAGHTLAASRGEIQYTDYGLSGIPAMQISRFAAEALYHDEKVDAYVDSLPGVSKEEFTECVFALRKKDPERSVEDVLAGFIPKKLGSYLSTTVSVPPVKSIGSVYDRSIDKLIAAVKKSKYAVSSVRGFADAQVTAGGVPASEINHETMGLKKVPGLYVCGEIADVDGDCGGYNLQWAFSSGAVAGISAVQERI